jgi:hypothetical protein
VVSSPFEFARVLASWDRPLPQHVLIAGQAGPPRGPSWAARPDFEEFRAEVLATTVPPRWNLCSPGMT